jgi:hypothetical protein
MTTTKCDLVLRLNEAEGKLTLHVIPSTQLDAFCGYTRVGFIRPASELRALEPDEAERWIGRMVLAELDLHSHSKIGIRDYAALAAEELRRFLADLEVHAQTGDREAEFKLFQLTWNAALKEGSQTKLDRADALLKSAAAHGHVDALAMTAAWPRLKVEAESRFSRPKPEESP